MEIKMKKTESSAVETGKNLMDNSVADVPTSAGDHTDEPIMQWAAKNRRLYKEGKLSSWKIAFLEEIPGWTWLTAHAVEPPLEGDTSERLLYWVAINGASAGMTPIPLPVTVMCTPTPELLIGLPTFERAERLQSLLLNAPLKIVRKEIEAQRNSKDAVIISPAHPQPQTRGATTWTAN